MNFLTLDFESMFSDDYTLSRLTTESYIRDSRFEAHGIGLRLPNGELKWLAQPEKKLLASMFDWGNTAVLGHHMAFDGLILSHVYDIHPKCFLDTYSMAAYLFPNAPKSLEALSQRFGLTPKTVPYDKVKGKHWAEMDAETRAQLAEGCLHDCELTYQIFQKMMTGAY